MSYRIDHMPSEILGEIAYRTNSLSDAATLSKTCKRLRDAVNIFCIPRLYSDCIRLAYNDPSLSYYCSRVLEESYFENMTIDQLSNPIRSSNAFKKLFLNSLKLELHSEALRTNSGKIILQKNEAKNISLKYFCELAAQIPPKTAIQLNFFFIVVCQNLYHYLDTTSQDELKKKLGDNIPTADQIEQLAENLDIGQKEGIKLNHVYAHLFSTDFESHVKSIPIFLTYAKKILTFFKSAEIQPLIKNIQDMIFKLEETGHSFENVPKEIAYFESLKRLDLSGCALENLPDEFKNLKELEQLMLGDNLFETIPEVLDELPNLEYVSISGDHFDDDYISEQLSKSDLPSWKKDALERIDN